MKRLLLLVLVPLMAQAAPRDDVRATFLEILTRDDTTFLAANVIANEQQPGWLFDLRDLLDRHDCFVLREQQWSVVSETNDAVTLTADLDATGTLKGNSHKTVPLFPRWQIEATREEGRWKLVRAQTEERRIANAMLAAPSLDEATSILDAATHVDRIKTIEIYADSLRIAFDAKRLRHALALALATGDRSLESFIRRAQFHVDLEQPGRVTIREGLPFVERIARESESSDDRLNAWFTIGLGQRYLSNVEASLAAYGEAARLADAADDPVRAIKAQQMRVATMNDAGRLTEALREAQQFSALVTRFHWEEGEVVALANEAGLHSSLNAHDYARDVNLRAAQLARERGIRWLEVNALHEAARSELLLENYDNAATLIAQTLHDVDPDHRQRMYTMAAHIAIERGRYEEADELLHQAADTIHPHLGERTNEMPLIHTLRSELRLRAGRTKEALDEAMLALPGTESWETSTGSAILHVQIFLTYARALRASKRDAEAIDVLRRALALVDDSGERILAGHELSQIGMIDSVRKAYEEMIELLVEHDEPAEALRVAERMRARGLRELIANGRIDISASMSEEERAREETLEARVVELNRQLTAGKSDVPKLAAARRELDAFRAQMRLAHPAVARRRVQSDPSLELPESRKDITAIEYVVTKAETIAFVAARGRDVRAVRLPLPRKKLATAARRFAIEVASASLTYRKSAASLHQMLLAPLGVDAAATLCIIPDVDLWRVPFQALIDASGKHVVDRHALFYAHSLSLAHDTTSTADTSAALLALGNPTVGASARNSVASVHRDITLGSLVDAEHEVRSLQALYTGERSRVYYRDAALETTFKREAPSYRVLHLAAHAIVDDRAPLYSSVVLAANNSAEDGLLEAREVVDLPLNADLAVLSACETGGGKIGAGEGVVGLSWAFFAAGCSTTVVSQWKAESRSTSKLMIEFHRRLLRGDSPAAALRAAQIALRRDAAYRHPFFWAPFVAIGAGGRSVH